MKFRKFVMLSVPGWSNIDAWIPAIFQMGSKAANQVDVFISSPWILLRLAKDDSLGLQLEAAGARFVLYVARDLVFSTTKFSSARRICMTLQVLNRLGVLRVFERTDWGGSSILERVQPISNSMILSDVTSLSSSLTERDSKAIQLLSGSTLYSLFHGTLELENDPLKIPQKIEAIFSKIVAFSSGPAQTIRFESADSLRPIEVVAVVAPRLRRAISHQETEVRGAVQKSIYFLSRSESELPNFSKVQATLSLARCAYHARQAGFTSLKIKAHPNEPKLSMRLRVFALNRILGNRAFRVKISSESVEDLYKSNKVLTWFSGLVVELGLAGVPCVEIGGVLSASPLGPLISSSSPWGEIHRRGLVRRISNVGEFRSWLFEVEHKNRAVLASFESNFYLAKSGKPDLWKELLSRSN